MTARVISGLLLASLLLAPLGCLTWRSARLYESGTAALDRGELGVAIDDLEEAARLRPDRTEIQNHLGLAYVEAHRWSDAETAFERAVALDCENDAAQENLAALRHALAASEGAPSHAEASR